MVYWGEEKIAPRPNSWSSCTIGQLFYKTRVRPGETVSAAFERAYAVVRRMGENFRSQKLKSFLAVLDSCGNDAATSSNARS